MSDLTRYSPVDDCSGMYQDDERGEYVDFFESKERIDALTTEISEQKYTLKLIRDFISERHKEGDTEYQIVILANNHLQQETE